MFKKDQALAAASYGAKGKDFKKNARDYFIGAHVYPPPRTLITDNIKDFWFIGDKWKYTPDEIMK